MIKIDKTEATKEELEYLKGLKGFNAMVFEVANRGRKNGVSITIKEITLGGAICVGSNSEEGFITNIVGSSATGKSFLKQTSLD